MTIADDVEELRKETQQLDARFDVVDKKVDEIDTSANSCALVTSANASV